MHAINFADDHAGFAYGKFVAFAPHGFDKNCQMQYAAAGNYKTIAGFFHPQRYIAFAFAEQTFTQMAAGNVFALFAEKRRIVDLEQHGNSRLVDGDRRHGFGVFHIAESVGYIDVFDAYDCTEVAAGDFFDFFACNTVKHQQLFEHNIFA